MEFPNTTTAIIISFLLTFGATVLIMFATIAATSTTISAKRALETLLPGCCATATTPANKKNSMDMEIDLEYGLEYVVAQGPGDFASDCDWRNAYATVSGLMDYESRFDCDALEFAGGDLEQNDSFGTATIVMGLRPVAVSAISSVAISTGSDNVESIAIVVDVEDEQEEESEDATATDDSEEQQQISAAVESATEVSTANDSSDVHEEDEHAAVDIEYLDSDEASDVDTNSDEPAQDDNAAADVVHLNGADEHVQDNNETVDLVSLGGDNEFAELDEVDIDLEEQTGKDDDRAVVEAASLDSTRFDGVDFVATDFSVSSSTTASLISSPRSECDLSVATDDEDAGDDEGEELEVRVDETAKPRESNIVRALDQFDWNGQSHLVLEDSDDDGSDDDEHESENDDEEDDGTVLAPRVVRSHTAETKMLAVQSNSVINTGGELVEIPLDASPSVLFHPDDIVDRADCCVVQ